MATHAFSWNEPWRFRFRREVRRVVGSLGGKVVFASTPSSLQPVPDSQTFAHFTPALPRLPNPFGIASCSMFHVPCSTLHAGGSERHGSYTPGTVWRYGKTTRPGGCSYMRNPYIRAKMVEALVAFLPAEVMVMVMLKDRERRKSDGVDLDQTCACQLSDSCFEGSGLLLSGRGGAGLSEE